MQAFLERFFLVSHVLSGACWTGAVFMAAVIDWTAIRKNSDGRVFPFDFLVTQGRLVFPAVYGGMITLFVSGVGLLWLHPPESSAGWTLLGVKVCALTFMAGSTIYGTLVSWPKLQFATHEEAFALYGQYIRRAYITFGCGCVGLVTGTILSRLRIW